MPSDSVTETTTTGWGSRMGQSFTGMLIGIVLVPATVFALYWNEGRAVTASKALDQGAKQTVEANAASVDPSLDGKLVHLSGTLSPSSSARDTDFGVSGNGLLRLRRMVEMYQWQQSTSTQSHQNLGGSQTTETTYSYAKIWSEAPIDSGTFHVPAGHENPPMQTRSATFDSASATIGPYRVDQGVLAQVSNFAPIQADISSAPAGYRVDGGGLYHGQDPAQPAVGDVKIAFEGVPTETVSVVAGQSSGTLAPFSEKGYTIALAQPGVASAAELFAEKKHEESRVTWIVRAVGFVVMVIAFMLVTRPLSMLFAVVPFLGWLAEAGAFLVALTVAVPVTLVTIAVAWFAHRPVIGAALILAAIGAIVLLRRFHRPHDGRAATAG